MEIRCCIGINKPTHIRIIIPTLEVVHADCGIVVVATVAEGVEGGDAAIGVILGDGASTPCVVGILGNGLSVLVGDSNDIALQVFQEVIEIAFIQETADTILIVVQRDQQLGMLGIVLTHLRPGFHQDLGAVQRVGMLHAVDGLTGTDAVGVVGIGVAVKGLELPPLLSTLSSVYLLW